MPQAPLIITKNSTKLEFTITYAEESPISINSSNCDEWLLLHFADAIGVEPLNISMISMLLLTSTNEDLQRLGRLLATPEEDHEDLVLEREGEGREMLIQQALLL